MPEIVLVEPDIPQNTGNIARLSAANCTKLHLIEPLGFSITDKNVKRAGLDYWPEVDLIVHNSWNHFLSTTGANDDCLWFFSTKAQKLYTDVCFREEDFLVFGCETKGLANYFHEQYPERRLRIPIDNQKVRSLNLANAVAIAYYEAKRQSY